MRWRAWYADETTIASDEACWHDLPPDGLLILKLWPDERPKRLACGHDAIWWDGADDTLPLTLDLPEPFRRVAAREANAGRLKYGKQVPNDLYERLHARALAAKE